MYKYSKDVLNIEEAKQYNSISHKKMNKSDTYLNMSNINNHNNKNNQNDMSDDYAVMLNNNAELKETCKAFIDENNLTPYFRQHIINYNSPEILLQASFLTSQLALLPINSRKSEDDE